MTQPNIPTDPVAAIYDAIDDDDPDRALEHALAALRSSEGEDPVVRLLGGRALIELDRLDDAVEWLARAVELDPGDSESRAYLAYAQFKMSRFDEAKVEATSALETDDTDAFAHEVMGMVVEREGRFDEADRHFVRAAECDPTYPSPSRMLRAEFERVVVQAGEQLPEPFHNRLVEVVVTVEDLPSDEILRESEPPLDPELFGLFVGIAITERTTFSPGGELPARILLFQRILERSFRDPDELRDEIATTLEHELGHYLGHDEDGLEGMDLA